MMGEVLLNIRDPSKEIKIKTKPLSATNKYATTGVRRSEKK